MPKHLLLIAAGFIVAAVILADRLEHAATARLEHAATARLEHAATAKQAIAAEATAQRRAAAEAQERYLERVGAGLAREDAARQEAGALLGRTPAFLVPRMLDAIVSASRLRIEELKVACGG